MGLFNDLPPFAPKRAEEEPQQPDEGEQREAKRCRADSPPPPQQQPTPSVYDARDPEEEEGHAAAGTAAQAPTEVPFKAAAPETSSGSGGNQISAALLRISQHLSNPKKFAKASQLLLQLLSHEGALEESCHGGLVFDALCASMANVDAPKDPLLAKDYSKLFTAASRSPELFTPEQRAQLDVYGLWTVVRHQLATDDSFVFSKTATTLKNLIAELPPLTSPEERAVEESALDTALSRKGEDARGGVWGEEAVTAARRAALVDCVKAAKERYGKAWARSTVDLLVEHAAKHAQQGRFLPQQRAALEELSRFVRDQKAARKLGTSAKEAARDTTGFERAAAEWGKATMSHRGKVGGRGDHKSEAWLG